MLTNKWIQFGLSAAIAFAGVAVGFDWSSVAGPRAAGVIVAGLGGLKMVLNAMAPSAGSTVVPTNGGLITHRAA